MYRPRPWSLRIPVLPLFLSILAIRIVRAEVNVDFADLELPAGVEFWNGNDGAGEFRSRGSRFANTYDSEWYWEGFAYSRVNDTNTPGRENQYAAFSGTGMGETGIYAIAYMGFVGEAAFLDLPVPSGVRGLYVNNTTYAALDMLNGSGFSKKFGGETGDDPDWFRLTVTGYEADGFTAGSASIYLADYRFEDNNLNYILNDWTWLCLTNLGSHVQTLRFALSSSDVGDWGMNTPAYFALGGLVTEETYAPAAGQPGSTAVSMFSGTIIGWASGWTNYVPGAHVDPSWQNPTNALGPASGLTTDIVCLGDGGEITMTFDPPIQDGPGFDFAIFENAFDDFFLELAYVEVSSDGENFSRFFNRSLTPDPVHFMGATVLASNVYGLAGKYRVGYGTPFDLGDLDGTPGLDLQNVRYVRIVDIIGDGTYIDTAGHTIYDPHPTDGSAGFDLEAVAVLSNATAEISLISLAPATDKSGASNALFAVRRKAWLVDEALEINLQFSGSTVNGLDYEALEESVILGAGESETIIAVRPIPDSAGRGDRDILVELQPGENYIAGRAQRTRILLHDVSFYDIWMPLQLRSDFNRLPLPDGQEYWNGADMSGGFVVNGVHFSNAHDDGYWEGFAYSRVNDTNTAGWMNQYAVFSGTALAGSGNYVIAYDSDFLGSPGTITLPSSSGVLGFYVNNTTFAALDMLNGSNWSKKFGGESGDDPDWFKLTVLGYDFEGQPTGSNSLYLADYRFEDNDLNYIVSDWNWLCLTNLGMSVKTLKFELSSSDVDPVLGMNTPAYFALDGLQIDPDSPGAAAAADWSGDGTANLMAYALGRGLGDYRPGSPLTVGMVANGEGTPVLAIEFDRRHNLTGVALFGEVLHDLQSGQWLNGPEHVLETVIGGNGEVDRIRATPVSPLSPAFMRLKAEQ